MKKVKIVDPDGVFRPEYGKERRGEAVVDSSVCPVRLAPHVDSLREAVQEGPKRAIGEASVVQAYVVLGEVEGRDRDHAHVTHLDRGVGSTLRRGPTPSQPQAALRRHSRLQRADQPPYRSVSVPTKA